MALAQVPPSGPENVPSALYSPAGPGLPRPLVDPAAIIAGGPPPDGIPAMLGHAYAGPLAGQNLTPVTHEDTFWFVWAAFRPDTRVVS